MILIFAALLVASFLPVFWFRASRNTQAIFSPGGRIVWDTINFWCFVLDDRGSLRSDKVLPDVSLSWKDVRSGGFHHRLLLHTDEVWRQALHRTKRTHIDR